jgi:hypothetical protein
MHQVGDEFFNSGGGNLHKAELVEDISDFIDRTSVVSYSCRGISLKAYSFLNDINE